MRKLLFVLLLLVSAANAETFHVQGSMEYAPDNPFDMGAINDPSISGSFTVDQGAITDYSFLVAGRDVNGNDPADCGAGNCAASFDGTTYTFTVGGSPGSQKQLELNADFASFRFYYLSGHLVSTAFSMAPEVAETPLFARAAAVPEPSVWIALLPILWVLGKRQIHAYRIAG